MKHRPLENFFILAIASTLATTGFAATATRNAPPPVKVAQAGKNAADEQTFKEFEQIVADFSPPEKISAWEAFLQKYPNSTYVPQVKTILTELKGGKKVPSSAPVNTDPDLDFLNDKPTPTPARAAATPVRARPTATPELSFDPTPAPTPQKRNTFMDGPEDPPANSDKLVWNDSGSSGSGSGSSRPASGGGSSRGSGGGERIRLDGPRTTPRSRTGLDHGIAAKYHLEVAPFFGFAPDETYVRNILAGGIISEHFGRIWVVNAIFAGAQPSETTLLRSLRSLQAEPEVISKYNWMAGGALQANLLSAMAPVSNSFEGRNDLFLFGGGGVVNTNVEICKQSGTVRCAAPLFISGVNFTYLETGVGHRFYFTHHILFRSDVHGRIVMELVDGKTTPRANIQVDVGPAFLF